MGVFQQLMSGGISDLFKSIMGEIHLSPEKKAEIEMKHAELEAAAVQADKDLEAKLQDVAGQNIRAEAQSGDKFTSRARPSFVYVMLGIMLSNYILFPLLHRAPIEFPEALFWLFGSCMLGYTGARTWEKIGAVKMGGK